MKLINFTESTYKRLNRRHLGYLKQETSKNIYLNPVNNYRNNYSLACAVIPYV